LRKMREKPVAGIGKPASELVLGTAWFSLKDRDLCFGLTDDFVAYGGNTLDTARIYGESEKVIGLWMEARANREGMVVVTKGGLSEEDPGRLAVEGFCEKVGRDITRSLECLRTDYIDLYFLHRDTPSIQGWCPRTRRASAGTWRPAYRFSPGLRGPGGSSPAVIALHCGPRRSRTSLREG